MSIIANTDQSVSHSNRRAIAYWLLISCALVFAMVVVGGLTRLTGSGLSMVDWRPVTGVLPPLTAEQWQAEFAQYQQSPEFKHVNFHFDVEEFKSIFWLEYWHRILGRVIGLVFFCPLLYFYLRRQIPVGLMPHLVAMFVLGGLQGLMGWYMVQSGLVDNPQVSQYRLTAHLSLAILIYAYMLWVALGLLMPNHGWGNHSTSGLQRASQLVWALVFLTILSGGFMAGLKAGFTYNTFPLMAGQWVPDGLFSMQPWQRNFFENVTTVQFTHRLFAMTTFLAMVLLWLSARRYQLSTSLRLAFNGLLILALVQMSLGIATLLWHVPILLASLHQIGALLVFTLLLYIVRCQSGSSGQMTI